MPGRCDMDNYLRADDGGLTNVQGEQATRFILDGDSLTPLDERFLVSGVGAGCPRR